MSTIPTCPACGKSFGIFRWRHQCVECSTTRCTACLRSPPAEEWLSFRVFKDTGDLCGDCYQSKAVPFVQKYEAALTTAKNLQTWSVNYKGSIPRRGEPTEDIASNWWREKESAERQLKVTAAYLGYDLVAELRYEKRTEEEPGTGKGTFYFTEWKATGIGCKRK
jgi:FYVE zinc finger